MENNKKIPKAEIEKIFVKDGQKKCDFVLGAHNSKQFPESNLKEFAFVGASNVGKSSLVNALTGQKVAIVSNTPGRTRQLNFFKLANKLMIVDMPGYGYAKARQKDISFWLKTSFEYISKRQQLVRVFLLIDPVKGLKDSDYEMADIFSSYGVSFQIILTKSDKIQYSEVEKSKEKIIEQTKLWPSLHPEILTSSSKNTFGMDDIKQEIVKLYRQ